MHYWVGEYLACAYCMSYCLYACTGILRTAVQSRVSRTCVSRIVHKEYRIEAETKWITFCRQHSSSNFLVWKLLYFNWNFTEFRSLSSSWELISFGSSLGSNRQQPGDKPLLNAMMIQLTDAYMRRKTSMLLTHKYSNSVSEARWRMQRYARQGTVP